MSDKSNVRAGTLSGLGTSQPLEFIQEVRYQIKSNSFVGTYAIQASLDNITFIDVETKTGSFIGSKSDLEGVWFYRIEVKAYTSGNIVYLMDGTRHK